MQNGNSALSIARRLGYISVVDTLRAVTEETPSSQVGGCLFAHHQVEPVGPERRTKTLVFFRELQSVVSECSSVPQDSGPQSHTGDHVSVPLWAF